MGKKCYLFPQERSCTEFHLRLCSKTENQRYSRLFFLFINFDPKPEEIFPLFYYYFFFYFFITVGGTPAPSCSKRPALNTDSLPKFLVCSLPLSHCLQDKKKDREKDRRTALHDKTGNPSHQGCCLQPWQKVFRVCWGWLLPMSNGWRAHLTQGPHPGNLWEPLLILPCMDYSQAF